MMSENTLKTVVVLGAGALIILYLLLQRPDYLSSSSNLALIVGAEVLLAAVLKYRRAFFPVLIAVFLCAGTDHAGKAAFLQARWVVLGVGALAGLAIYMKTRGHHFGVFHLIGFFCILSAAVSASVSNFPGEARLKAVSLALLFVYAASGARIAVPEIDPTLFFRRILIACEFLTWFSAISCFIFHWEVYGNPNSLGAIMGIVVIPMLLWGIMTTESRIGRSRLVLELAVAALVLLGSFARSSIGAAVLSCFLLCLALKQYRMMFKGAAAALLIASGAIFLLPHSTRGPSIKVSQSLGSVYLYKGHDDDGVFGSRRSVWQETLDSIKENPWLGTGFGTSKITEDMTKLQYAQHHVDSWIVREHGNSYLAIAEWTGLLGVLPFYLLVVMAAANAWKVFARLRVSRDVMAPAVPAAMIVVAGLFNAMFEDWMFAVGYYLCVFFWVNAFLLVDMVPRRAMVLEPVPFAPPGPGEYLPAAAGQ
jgi:O-antigen ligase